MTELSDMHEISAAQTLRMLMLQEAQLRDLAERVRFQNELLEATANALATICPQLPDGAREVAAKLRDLMFDRENLIDRASPL